ncbi:hypothetical protein ACHAXT_005557 [Thalassiosira profunda]
MINRSKRRPAAAASSAVVINSEKTYKGARGRAGRKRPRTSNCCGSLLLLVILIAIFAITYLGRMVDWSFLGGVFLVGLRSPSTEQTSNFPDGWEEYDYNDIRDHFGCKHRSRDDSKSLPSLEDWNFMRKKFTEVVDNDKEWDDPVPPTLGYSLERHIPVPPPYYAKVSEHAVGGGRGLFASRDIDEGELVHDGTRSDVIFPDAIAWRRFVFSLPREFACDSTDWHWMQRLEEDGPYFLLAGINISSLMNSGGKEFGPGRSPNALPDSPTSGKFYATRDIAKNEEILTDYDAYYTNWSEVGL